MILILDSCEFEKNPWPKGTKWALLAEARGQDIFVVNTRNNWDVRRHLRGCEDLHVMVPAIVIDETVNHVRTVLKLEGNAVDRGLKRIGKLLPDRDDLRAPTIHMDDAVQGYRADLVRMLGQLGVQMPGAANAVASANGRTVKGNVICQLVLDYLAHSDQNVAIITTNAHELGSPGQLAPGLLADLEKSKMPSDRVQIHRSLTDFLKSYLIPRMKEFKKMIGKIVADKHPNFKLTDWFRDYHDVLVEWVTEMVEDWSDCPGFFLPQGFHSPQLAQLFADGEINLIDAYQMDNGQLVLFLWCYVGGIVACTEDIEEISKEKQGRVTFDFDFSVVLDPKDGTVQDFELGSTHGFQRWAEDWPQQDRLAG